MTFLDFIMFLLDVILGHTPLTSPLLSLDQKFGLRLLRIRRSDFAFIWIRRSDFVFCISGVQTSPSFASDVQTSSASHSLAPQSDVQTSSSAYQAFRLCLNMDQMFRLHLYHIC